MLKNDKGITLISLTITIIVLIILVSITTNSGFSTVRNAKYYNAISELKIMQLKVNEMYEEYKNGDESILENGQEINGEIEDEFTSAYNSAMQENVNGTNIGLKEDYRYYSVDYIKDKLDLEVISVDFFVNIKVRSVILVKGIKMDERVYYALCQIEGEQYNVEYEN